jgi:hypothetical protein
MPKVYRRTTPHVPSRNAVDSIGIAAKTMPQKYTGNNLVGIAIMHKSNLVPVFSQTQACELSAMRR